jgi:CRISPR-associated exonuclease Cas4
MKRGNGETIIGEIKKSSRSENSAKMQLAFYLHRLKKRGISARGELLIPREKKRVPVELTENIESELKGTFPQIKRIMEQFRPPEPVKIRYCTRCAKEFCWV